MLPLSLFPHQVAGVAYLKNAAKHALLWDEQRVGKTPQAIVASGEMGLANVLVITPVAGVGVWRNMWRLWDRWDRTPTIIPWSQVVNGYYAAEDLARHYDLLILDESHYAKNFSAKRTRRVFGNLYGGKLEQAQAIAPRSDRVWCLTGTPAPHDVSDMFPVLKALFPSALAADAARGFSDVSTFENFRTRYCVIVNRRINNRMIAVVIRGKNTSELQRRLHGLFIRRRQSDVGIRPAFWDRLPVAITAVERARMFGDIDGDAARRALRSGSLSDPVLAVIRRITGTYKAHAIAVLARSYFEAYEAEKLVLAYWHRDVGDVLERELTRFNPVRVDGAVTGDVRTGAIAHFQSSPNCRVFLAQIAAAGEAIDLSASSELWFVESTFTPAQMAQMGARITNFKQPKQCLVRVAALEDSIDELIQDRLVDLSRSIANTLGETSHENYAHH